VSAYSTLEHTYTDLVSARHLSRSYSQQRVVLAFKVSLNLSLDLFYTNSTIEYIARGISDYLTSETGVTVVFESAIVPKWKDSRISFKNVYISRRPGERSARKPRDSHAGHKAAVAYDINSHPAYHGVGEDDHEHEIEHDDGDDSNYAMFDFNVDSIDVTLSLWRWLDGKGLIQDAVIKGVRGVLG
jgi:distribution and morphology protein 31